jgi:hydrogenase expression/formation protein HypC
MCLAVPGRVVDRFDREGMPMAHVDVRGSCAEVCLVFLPEAGVGDWVLVQLGMAVQCLDEDEAREHLQLLTEFAQASGAGLPGNAPA